LWYLGADSDALKAAYADQCAYQRPSFASPGAITKENWTEHLGDEKYYNAYLAFFTEEVAAKGVSDVIEEYIFSPAANFPGTGGKVEMLNRFCAGLLHPMIQLGYGCEFNVPGMIIEGLGHTVAHSPSASVLTPESWFRGSIKAKPNSTPSALNIFARVLADPEIPGIRSSDDVAFFKNSVQQFGDKVLGHIESWSPDLSTKEGLQKALEEVVWAVTLMYGVAGLSRKEDGLFNADFFHMHFVTSSMFLSSILVHLEPKSRELLLRTYLGVCLVWYLARGKPHLDIEAFFQDSSTLKSLTGPASLTGPSHNIPAATAHSPNPWAQIVQQAIVHPDDHLPKLQRTLAHYAQVYGNREAGYFKDCELKGAEKIDGTLFVRAANLTAFRTNRKREGEQASYWDRRGFYKD